MEVNKKKVTKTKRVYISPKLKNLGSVKKLTLKAGSNTDGFGTFN